jgi:hypothetical protein
MTALVLTIAFLILRPFVAQEVASFVSGIPQMLSGGVQSEISGTQTGSMGQGSGKQQLSGETEIVIYLTKGNSPNGERVTSFKASEYSDIYFWVQGPAGQSIAFGLHLTFGEGAEQDFGPGFTTDPQGTPIPVGQFASRPEVGQYVLDARASTGSVPIGSVLFSVEP